MAVSTQNPATIAAQDSNRFILAVDIGGTLIKTALIDDAGQIVTPWQKMLTPQIRTPESLLDAIAAIAEQSPGFDRVSIAFPGHVRQGEVITAPNLGTRDWSECFFAERVSQRLNVDCRILNDAIVQGLGVVDRPGLCGVLTFGTGMGCAVFRDRSFVIQLELGRHMSAAGVCYDDAVGHKAFLADGPAVWNDRVLTAVQAFKSLVEYDHLYIGGGNARHIENIDPERVTIIPNTSGITGGARMWQADAEQTFGWKPRASANNDKRTNL